MGIFERFDPEKVDKELCVRCPRRDNGILGSLAAWLALGRSYQAQGCASGVVVVHRSTETFTGMGATLSFAFSEAAGPITIQREKVICGQDEAAGLAGQIVTESFLVDGREVEVRLMRLEESTDSIEEW